MSEIIDKAKAASEICHDDESPAWQRVWKSLSALSGMMLSDLDPENKMAVIAELAAVSAITRSYGFSAGEDYESLSDEDAGAILSHINTTIEHCFTSEVERVMEELGTDSQELPVAAIEEVRENETLFLPYLHTSLRGAINLAQTDEEPEEGAAFFAALLLTELRSEDAYPTLIDLFRLPGTRAEGILGEGVYELAAPILALCCGKDIGVLASIVGDRRIDFYVRWSVAHTYAYLIRDGVVERQQAIDAILDLFDSYVAERNDEMVTALACELGYLAATSALEAIRDAQQQGLLDDTMVSLSFLESQIAAGDATLQASLERCRPTGMPDTVEELSGWASFNPEPTIPEPRASASPTIPSPHVLSSAPRHSAPSEPIRVESRVGRNDPCPCGSGKKFKKCCRRNRIAN